MIWLALEAFCALFFAAGFILETLHVQDSEKMLLLSLLCCLVVYGLLGAFTLRDHKGRKNKILLSALCGFTFALAAVAVWLKVSLIANTFFISMGVMFLLTLSFGFTYMSEQKREEGYQPYYRRMMLRLMVFSALVLLSIWMPDASLVRWKYSNWPEMRDVKLQRLENPRDTTLMRLEKQLESQAGKK